MSNPEPRKVYMLGNDSLESKVLDADLKKNPDMSVQDIKVEDSLKLADNIKNNIQFPDTGEPVIVYLANPSSDYLNDEFSEQINQVLSEHRNLSLVRSFEQFSEADIPMRAKRLKLISDIEARKLTRERRAKMREDLLKGKQKYVEDQRKLEEALREEMKDTAKEERSPEQQQ
jgi:CRISPR/Cas system endoribonuclease Cas6 (RAMP superfamily)